MRFVRLHVMIAGCIVSAGFAGTAPAAEKLPIRLKLLSVKKIWDQGKHNAFTDLIRFGGRFYCVFREGAGHVSNDGKIRVLAGDDEAKTWKSAALIALKGYDLRDAKISRMPDGG